ncbi:MAG: hypothetical protein KKB12_04395 [Candidatus Omnitrophica bacterium]|nr:hypothetical protein [Candidatus Omnitrophota bacterium]
MGCRTTTEENRVALMCSTSGWAFGPTFKSETLAVSFIGFCFKEYGLDPRAVNEDKLDKLHRRWLNIHSCAECGAVSSVPIRFNESAKHRLCDVCLKRHYPACGELQEL